MALRVVLADDPREILERARTFLMSDPIRHNLILTLLEARRAAPEVGRYLLVFDQDDVVGVVLQSPTDYPATITPMPEGAARRAVDALVGSGCGDLPGVTGVALAAAAFAGAWTERVRGGAHVDGAQRLYEATRVDQPTGVQGFARPATERDRKELVDWTDRFASETGARTGQAAATVARRLEASELRVWDDGGGVAMCVVTPPAAGVVRVGLVYTPAASRGRGYASALVARVSADALRAGSRCALYTDLANATSNAIYRAIGYRCVAEILSYRFG